jgi:RNA polymerase sigma-70 factor, ECF subfamily
MDMRGEDGSPDGVDIAGLKRREPRAVERWFLDHADGLYTFVFYRVGKDPGLAADVVQETFVGALEDIGAYDPLRGSIHAWLTTRARNEIRRALRDERRSAWIDRWEAIDRDLARVEPVDDGPFPDEVLERRETAELVQMALSNLPLRYSRVLQRHYCHRQPLKAIAEADGMTEMAVKALLHRARLSFKSTYLAIARNSLPATRGSIS